MPQVDGCTNSLADADATRVSGTMLYSVHVRLGGKEYPTEERSDAMLSPHDYPEKFEFCLLFPKLPPPLPLSLPGVIGVAGVCGSRLNWFRSAMIQSH